VPPVVYCVEVQPLGEMVSNDINVKVVHVSHSLFRNIPRRLFSLAMFRSNVACSFCALPAESSDTAPHRLDSLLRVAAWWDQAIFPAGELCLSHDPIGISNLKLANLSYT